MSLLFVHQGSPARIVFGKGTRNQAAAEVDRLGAKRALVLSTHNQRTDAEALAAELGALAVGVFSGAAMHTPVEVTNQAMGVVRDTGADCVVALGGGSTTGLGKAIALRTDLPQVVIPTTYAGSEATPILGETEGGVKTTRRDPRILPEVVIYDPDLSLGLPVPLSVTSGLNAIAHAAEGLYAADRSPIWTLLALDGMRALRDALPRIVANSRDEAARANALYGAWGCGTVLGAVSMALHHKLCHVLGGSFDLPHAETHAVMLPHTIAFNAAAVPDLLRPVAEMFGGGSPGAALHDFARALGAPTRLQDLGLGAGDLDRAAEIATRNPYPNPRALDRTAIRALLDDAFHGRRPAE